MVATLNSVNMVVTLSIIEFLKSGFILSSGTDEFWLGWGSASRVSKPAQKGFFAYAPDFFLKDETPWWGFPFSEKVPYSMLIQFLTEFVKNLDSEISSYSATDSAQKPTEWFKPDFSLFQSTFLDLKHQFQSGVLRKAVPIVFEKADFKVNARNKARGMLQLLSYSRHLPVHVYGIWNEEEGILGATPELLFRQSDEGVLHTVALAGTRLKTSSELSPSAPALLPSLLPSLLDDPKEREEHQIVIEGICSSLKKFGKKFGKEFGKIEVGTTSELNLPTLSHLITPISMSLPTSFSIEELARQLHPTPALGAYPREEGMKWLASYQEKTERYRFGAPLGARWETGESRCVVAIRNLQWNSAQVFIGAGCGIISQSQLDREWRELQGKIHSVKKMFGFFGSFVGSNESFETSPEAVI